MKEKLQDKNKEKKYDENQQIHQEKEELTSKPQNKNSSRKYYLDNIRYFTILTVVLFHVIYMFNGVATPGVVGPFTPEKYQPQDTIQYIVYPWIMAILFIVAGISSRLYLIKHNSSSFFSDRTTKLLVPTTLGLLTFQWIQGYYNMQLSDAFNKIPKDLSPFIKYLIMCLSGNGVLWFNQVLWVYSLLLVLILKIDKNNKLLNLCQEKIKINFLWIIILGFLLWVFCQILNTPVICCYRFGIYGFSFFLGYFIFSNENININY